MFRSFNGALSYTFAPIFIAVWLVGSAVQAANWTVMVYMAGDNNLSDALVNDVLEMMKVGSTKDVNIVVQAELSSLFSSFKHNGHTYRFRVLKDRLEWHDLGTNLDMADPATLSAFIGWASRNYPADHYALFLWDHGLGWMGGNNDTMRAGMRGLLEDRTSGTFMSLGELKDSLAQSAVFFDLIEFDACLMGMLEVAATVYDYTKYITFSEATEPGDGNPYDKIFHLLVSKPEMGGRQLAATIVYSYVEHYRNAKNGLVSVTKSGLDSTIVPSLVTRTVSLAEALEHALSDPSSVDRLVRVQKEVQTFYGLTGSTDLYDFCDKVADLGGEVGQRARAVKMLFNNDQLIESHYTPQAAEGGLVATSSVSSAHGIAIFFPWFRDVTRDVMHEYRQFCSSAGMSQWFAFVDNLHHKVQETHMVTSEGGFIIAAFWTDSDGFKSSADIDLYVVEPDAAYAPWLGQTTPNGFFSADSLDSGNNFEVYTARERVEKGLYLPVLNLYDLGFESRVRAYCFYSRDPSLHNVITWGPNFMDMYLPAPDPEDWDEWVMYLLSMNFYSDWWIPGEVQKTLSRAPLPAVQAFWNAVRDQYLNKRQGAF